MKDRLRKFAEDRWLRLKASKLRLFGYPLAAILIISIWLGFHADAGFLALRLLFLLLLFDLMTMR
jgi:hypothetical protein